MLEEFVRFHGDSRYAALARARMDELRKSQAAAADEQTFFFTVPLFLHGILSARRAGRQSEPAAAARRAAAAYQVAEPAPAVPPDPAPAAAPPKPQAHSGWIIQVGAYRGRGRGQAKACQRARARPASLLGAADAVHRSCRAKASRCFYRARFAGLDKDQAEAACNYLKGNDVACLTIAEVVGQPPAQSDTAQPANSPGPGPVAAGAQRVVLYEEDPNEPQGKQLRRLGGLAHRDGFAGAEAIA